VRIAVLNGSFTKSEAAVTPDRLRDLSVVTSGGRVALPRASWQPHGDTTWLTLMAGEPGTYVVGASLLPREIALAAKDFNLYLEEDGIPTSWRRARATATSQRTRASAIRTRESHLPGRRSADKNVRNRAGICGRDSCRSQTLFRGFGDTVAFRCLVDVSRLPSSS